ncbi:MAG: DegV family protein [Butyrivibrio sp.]|nr:DegV family protein [Butyrivibrio sp.]
MSLRILTDSASDLVNYNNEKLSFVPLTITYGDEEYQDSVNLTHEEFYEKLIETDELPKTSQVAPYVFEEEYEKAKAAGDTLLVITLSSKLSGTYQSANIARDGYEDMVYIVDSKNVTVGEAVLIEYALRLIDEGKDVEEIVKILEEAREKVVTIGLLDTLEYLKKGGRISKTAAFAGNLLSIKPVICIEDGEVAILGKARGSKQGNNLLMQQIDKYGGIDFDMPLFLGYAGLSDAVLQKYIADSAHIWKDKKDSLPILSVGGTIGTHVGPGAIALAFFSNMN